MWEGKTVLVTGGTGSLGKALAERLLQEKIKKLIVYSRDEFKQHQMSNDMGDPVGEPRLRFFIGDVRDLQRLKRAMNGVDYVVHAAALKQVPALEYNPTEAIKTNVNGAMNVVEASMDCGIDRVVSISTDKAVNPINLYGATKLCAEKIFTAANEYAGHTTMFSSVRYGNVIGSRGSVIPFFQKLREQGKKFPITDYRMTRFLITLGQAVDLVLFAMENMRGGEIFVPRISSATIHDIAKAVWDDAEFEYTSIRAGEKIHECLYAEGEINVVIPGYLELPEGPYTSENAKKLSAEEIRCLIDS